MNYQLSLCKFKQFKAHCEVAIKLWITWKTSSTEQNLAITEFSIFKWKLIYRLIAPKLRHFHKIVVQPLGLNTLSKLSFADSSRFDTLLKDTFPFIELQNIFGNLLQALNESALKLNLTINENRVITCHITYIVVCIIVLVHTSYIKKLLSFLAIDGCDWCWTKWEDDYCFYCWWRWHIYFEEVSGTCND